MTRLVLRTDGMYYQEYIYIFLVLFINSKVWGIFREKNPMIISTIKLPVYSGEFAGCLLFFNHDIILKDLSALLKMIYFCTPLIKRVYGT
jgi:hypothetical protein